MNFFNMLKEKITDLLKRCKGTTLIFAAGLVVLAVFTIIGMVKISASGGMAKAKKEAEIAYSDVHEKERKHSEKSSAIDEMNKTTTAPAKPATTKKKDSDGTREGKINNFYGEAAFVGDSVMLGFCDYCDRMGEGFLGEPTFLVAGSFSLFHALRDSSDASILPLYRGVQTKVEDALSQMTEVKRVFLFFGINDLNMTDGVDGTYDNYVEFIRRVLKARPDIEINVISTTYMLYGSDSGYLTNENIGALNDRMEAFCKEKGYGYVDIATKLGDRYSGLNSEYCSDNYVHQTTAAYEIWVQALKDFAP